MTVPRFQAMKAEGRKITMLTAYDYSMARLLDETGIESILVGDSMSMVVQGHPNTLPVTLDEMIYHAEMVGRAVRHALVIVDMPFPSYHLGKHKAIENAGRILKETRCQAVKLEGGADQADVIAALGPEDALRLFDAWDAAPRSGIGRTTVRGPSLRSALTRWASTFGLEVEFAPDVPDLGRGEFVLSLPEMPSVKALDRSLAGLCLAARREGRTVTISIDENAARLNPEVAAVLAEGDPESRLRAYLDNTKVEESALYRLARPWQRGENVSCYTPRVELDPDSLSSMHLRVDGNRPLGEQLFALRAQGLRLETEGGVLRFVPVGSSRP